MTDHQRRSTAALNFDAGFDNGDAFYAALVDAVDSVGDEAAPQLLARLVLILANQIGRADILAAAIETAKADLSD
jgi:hypothetical protein